VKLSPPIIGQPWGLVEDLEYFVLANRHDGENLFPVTEFPCFVHIARLLSNDVRHREVISASDLETIAWGEMYLTRESAENHVFGSG